MLYTLFVYKYVQTKNHINCSWEKRDTLEAFALC